MVDGVKNIGFPTFDKKAFDKTLDAIDDLEEAIIEKKTQKLTADPDKANDLDKITSILEKA